MSNTYPDGMTLHQIRQMEGDNEPEETETEPDDDPDDTWADNV